MPKQILIVDDDRAVLAELLEHPLDPRLVAIIFTACATIETAVEAIKLGAFNCSRLTCGSSPPRTVTSTPKFMPAGSAANSCSG